MAWKLLVDEALTAATKDVEVLKHQLARLADVHAVGRLRFAAWTAVRLLLVILEALAAEDLVAARADANNWVPHRRVADDALEVVRLVMLHHLLFELDFLHEELHLLFRDRRVVEILSRWHRPQSSVDLAFSRCRLSVLLLVLRSNGDFLRIAIHHHLRCDCCTDLLRLRGTHCKSRYSRHHHRVICLDNCQSTCYVVD